MGVTQRLGTIPLAIFTDASNNIGIGGSPSGSYKFEVTGTGRFTGKITSSVGNDNIVLENTSATTGYLAILRAVNSGGNLGVFLENSSGGNRAVGTLPYSVGLAQYENAALHLVTNNNVRLTVTGSGNVGIGTSSPPTILNVIKDGSSSYVSNTYAGAAFMTSRTTANGENIAIRHTGAGVNGISGTNYAGQIISDGNNIMEIYTTSTGPLVLGTNSTERMRITSGGFLKASNTGTYYNATGNYHEIVSNSNNNNNVHLVNSNNTSPYGPWINFSGTTVNNTTNYFLAGSDTTNDKFFIYGNGSMYNRTGTYGTISDIKFKENIVDATPKLDDLIKLKVRNFNMIGDETKQIGFIAQEFEEVFPKMVDINTDKEGETHKAIKTSVLVPMLVKAIQELSAKVSALENKS